MRTSFSSSCLGHSSHRAWSSHIGLWDRGCGNLTLSFELFIPQKWGTRSQICWSLCDHSTTFLSLSFPICKREIVMLVSQVSGKDGTRRVPCKMLYTCGLLALRPKNPHLKPGTICRNCPLLIGWPWANYNTWTRCGSVSSFVNGRPPCLFECKIENNAVACPAPCRVHKWRSGGGSLPRTIPWPHFPMEDWVTSIFQVCSTPPPPHRLLPCPLPHP